MLNSKNPYPSFPVWLAPLASEFCSRLLGIGGI